MTGNIVKSWDSECGVDSRTVVVEIETLQDLFGQGYLNTFTENEIAFIVYSSSPISARDARKIVKDRLK